MNEKIFVNEQTVWVLNPWGQIDECEVLEIPQWNTNYYKLKIKNAGWYTQIPENIFSSYREAVIEKAKRSRKKVNEYKARINNLKELFDFMVWHMSEHETTDYEAIGAAKERILELIGINLNEED